MHSGNLFSGTLVNDQVYDVVVVGGGIVGAATLYQLARQFPQLKLALLEKEPVLAAHQTGRNSGVIHSGIYYKPGSYKARNCTEGREMLYAFAAEHGIAHSRCGKVIVATRPEEVERLPGLVARGEANGLTGLKIIQPHEIQAIEPHVEGLAGIWVPQTGWIDFAGTTRVLAAQAQHMAPRTDVMTGTAYIRHTDHSGLARVTTSRGELQAKHLVFCGGLQADRLAAADGLNPGLRIVGFRGDYYEMTASGAAKVRNLIYPVPNPEFPFLGVHFTRMHDGSVECGPNAVFTFKREGYRRGDFSLRDTADALGYTGTWRLFAKHWQNGLMEMQRAWSKPLFLKTLQQLIPSLEMADLGHHRAGVRAQALNPDGTLVDDFVIMRGHRSVHILNAPSPAATACLSIGLRVASEVQSLLEDHG